MYRKLLGTMNVDLNIPGQLPIIYFAFIIYLRKKGHTMKQCSTNLQTSRKPMIQLGGRSCIIFSSSLVSP